jgi:dihydroorotase-like cyclic amidohydrolase
MLTLIENGEIYSPEPGGVKSILIAFNKILRIGDIERRAVESLGVEAEYVDAANCYITPGLIDPHQHLLGGSGERGFASQTPEISASEIIEAGITTVVGLLGRGHDNENDGWFARQSQGAQRRRNQCLHLDRAATTFRRRRLPARRAMT